MNEWTYRFTKKAKEELDTLDLETARRIISKLEEIINSEFREPPRWLEPLESLPYQKLRIGEYRALIIVKKENNILEIHSVGHRKNIYDR